MSKSPPAPTHVLETCLYVKSIEDARSFYQDILGLDAMLAEERMSMFPLGVSTLILFQLGLTNEDIHPSGRLECTIPKHGPSPDVIKQLQISSNSSESRRELRQHFCLAVPNRSDVEQWEEHFKVHDVKILGVVDWERGGRSVYFADPDGHVGEIASRGVWPHY